MSRSNLRFQSLIGLTPERKVDYFFCMYVGKNVRHDKPSLTLRTPANVLTDHACDNIQGANKDIKLEKTHQLVTPLDRACSELFGDI